MAKIKSTNKKKNRSTVQRIAQKTQNEASKVEKSTEKIGQTATQAVSDDENIPVKSVDAKSLKSDDLVLDIRSHFQHALTALKRPHWHVEGADIDPTTFIKDFALDGKKTLYIICNTGRKSIEKAREFIRAGFKNVASVTGGIEAAKAAGLAMTEHPIGDVQRQVPLTAGIGILIGLIGGMMISGWFYLIPLVIGIGLVTWGITGECTIEKILSYMPWNQK